jgi:hypothetical protein
MIVMKLANELKEGREGDLIPMVSVSTGSHMNYETIKDYVELISYIKERLPDIALENAESGMAIRILRPARLDLDPKQQLLLWLFDKDALRETRAKKVKGHEREILEECSKLGLIAIVDDKAYLTIDGIVEAAKVSGLREEALMEPIGQLSTREAQREDLQTAEDARPMPARLCIDQRRHHH